MIGLPGLPLGGRSADRYDPSFRDVVAARTTLDLVCQLSTGSCHPLSQVIAAKTPIDEEAQLIVELLKQRMSQGGLSRRACADLSSDNRVRSRFNECYHPSLEEGPLHLTPATLCPTEVRRVRLGVW